MQTWVEWRYIEPQMSTKIDLSTQTKFVWSISMLEIDSELKHIATYFSFLSGNDVEFLQTVEPAPII